MHLLLLLGQKSPVAGERFSSGTVEAGEGFSSGTVVRGSVVEQ